MITMMMADMMMTMRMMMMMMLKSNFGSSSSFFALLCAHPCRPPFALFGPRRITLGLERQRCDEDTASEVSLDRGCRAAAVLLPSGILSHVRATEPQVRCGRVSWK